MSGWLYELMFGHVKEALLPSVTSSWEAGAGWAGKNM